MIIEKLQDIRRYLAEQEKLDRASDEADARENFLARLTFYDETEVLPKFGWTLDLPEAARLHCYEWQSEEWEEARKVRDEIIDRLDPEWPHQRFWDEVEKICLRPE